MLMFHLKYNYGPYVPRNIKRTVNIGQFKTSETKQLLQKLNEKSTKQIEKTNMSYCNIKTHLIYGVWLLTKDESYVLEDTCPEGRGLEPKTLEENGLVLIEFYCLSWWVLGIKDSHQEQDSNPDGMMNIGQNLTTKSEWSKKLLAYCKRQKIRNTKDPQWRILTYYEKDNSVISRYRDED